MLSPAAFVDGVAAETPNNVWVKISSHQDNVWQDITWLQLSRSVDCMARWIEKELGLGEGGEPVAYAGVNDIRCPIIILAALKTGYKSLLTSPRNSREGNLSLLETTGCTKFLFTPELCNQVTDLTVETPDLQVVQVPDLQELLTDTDNTPYKSTTTEIGDQETVTILHSSGTTGLPKPVYIKAGVLRVASTFLSMPVLEGRRNVHNEMHGTDLIVSAIPFFHVFGIMLFVRSIYHQRPLALLSPDRPPTAELLLDAISTVKPTAVVCPPSLLEDICNLPDGLDKLSTLDSVLYGGAPLSRHCGEKITKVTTLLAGIGSTEAFNIPNLVPADPADWEYFEWNAHAGIVMEPTPDPQLAELVIQRLPESEYQCVFHNFPDLPEWRTKDLFEQHPTKVGLWKYMGRADDIIVLSNGEKLNPVSFEKAIEGHPWVRGALVVGAAQFQAGLIIEPHPEQAAVQKEVFIDKLWAWVEDANAQSPAHARVWRSMVTLASPNKPFKRAPKGSVMRQANYRLYAEEIELLYGGRAMTNGYSAGVELDSAKVRYLVRKAVRSVLGSRAEHVEDDTNLFSIGADSLQVMQLCQVLGSSSIKCTTKMVYENPSIELLSRAVDSGRNTGNCSCDSVSREEKMSVMIHRHTKAVREEARRRKSPAPSGRCVLLVGSTGALGTHFLYELMENPGVSHVYCLNRSEDAAERQAQAFSARGLGSVDFHAHPRVHFLRGETYQENFGLSILEYAGLESMVEMVILNAWPVNFNSSLDSFERVISGTKRVADFAASARRRPHVVFVSSVASVLNFPVVRSNEGDGDVLLIPEEFEGDNSLPAKQGYGESKHVASAVLAKVVKEASIRATVMRVGQLAGTACWEGAWNKQEWVPTLIKTSKSLGKIPRSLGLAYDGIIWVPVDIAAKAILDLAPVDSSQASKEGMECFNVVNPQVTHWGDLVAVIQRHYAELGQGTIEAVGFAEWLDELREIGAANGADEADRYPALKLLDFFEEMKGDGGNGRWGFGTENAVERSSVMAELGAVDGKLMQKWLQEWKF